MRASQLHLVTYREDPAEAEVISHKLMVRAGYIFKVSSGVYAYAPLMWRVLRKVEQIVREELDRDGALEVQLPILQSSELWEQSGRWENYVKSGTMFQVTDRGGSTYGLAPTAEEVITAYARASVTSYKQLPLCLYQIHTKFRDEIRPRFGLLRGKEFLMMDAYSFDTDQKGLDVWYERMRLAYHRIFHRMDLEAFGVDADPGDIGGSGSMEFMIASDTGEDSILIEPNGDYAANVEKASSRCPAPASKDEEPNALRIEDTPGIRTCEQLHGFFPEVALSRMVKTVLFKAVHAEKEQLWAALIRGDQEINEIKLKNHTGGLALEMLTEDEIRTSTGAEQGFAGPIGLPETFQVVADKSVRGMRNLLCGCNQTDKHALDVNVGRDFAEPAYVDFRMAREGEPGPRTGEPLALRKGIEAGHIFKLGSVYSSAMGATFMAENGKPAPFVMGCYGIGVSRIAAAAVEQFADERGIVWPVPIAPFEVAVACLSAKDDELVAAAEQVAADLEAQGLEVMLDDRKLSAGAKMKDLELIGIPYLVLIGRTWKNEGKAEVRNRRADTTENLTPDELTSSLVAQIRSEREGVRTA